MDHSSSYERVLPLPRRGAHLRTCVILYALYGALAVGGIAWFLSTLAPYALLLAALVDLALILLTRKHLQVEYEYAFLGGTLCVARILGKSTRRVVCELDLEELILADYLTEESATAAARLNPEETEDARTDSDAPALILVWENKKKNRYACMIETDERSEQILRRSRPEACSLALKRAARPRKN